MNRIYLSIATLLILCNFAALAQEHADSVKYKIKKNYSKTFEYRIKAGVNIGGTSPLPLPREIRDIEGYSPALSLSLGADVVRHINNKWAVMSGITFETKGMTAEARVKNYYISMVISDGDAKGKVNGVFTGRVKTKAKNEYLTIPLAAVHKISPRWELNAGFFFSYLMDGSFSGEASDGFIRDETPVGEELGVTAATYDFSDDLRRFNWGGQFGARWRAYRQFSVYGDLSWAANSIFKKNFTSISFDMYNVYFNMGFAYTF